MQRQISQSRQTRCYLDIFHFTKQSIDTGSLETKKYQLYDNVIGFSYSKNLSNPAGSFQCKVRAIQDYSKIISPGDWVQIYLTTDTGNKYKRVIGNVDRVALEEVINEEGIRETYFVISGRDFGKIFQDTSIWFNPHITGKLKAIILDKVNNPGGPSNVLIKKLIDLFLNDTISVPNCSTSMNYWYIGNKFAKELGESGHPQFADLINMSDFSIDQPGFKMIPILNAQGNIWNLLKSISNEIINSMFCELYQSENSEKILPKLFFGVRPYAFKNHKTSKLPIRYFLDLDSVEVNAKEIIGSSIGINDHDRINLFFLRLKENPIFKAVEAGIYSDPSLSKVINLESIKRNGLRLFSKTLDYANSKDGKLDLQLYKAYIDLIASWYRGNHLLENGTFNVLGNPDTRLGKRLIIKNSEIYPNRQYLIEAYTDNWSFGQVWRQTLEVTRGITVENGKEKYAYEGEASLFNVTSTSKISNKKEKDILPGIK